MDKVACICPVSPEGKLILPDYIAKWLVGKEFVFLDLEKYFEKISKDQRALYFGWDIPQIIHHEKERTGITYTRDDVHLYHCQEVIKSRFTTKRIMGKTVVTFSDPGISDMNTKEFSLFREKYILHWAEKGLAIIDPPDTTKDSPILQPS